MRKLPGEERRGCQQQASGQIVVGITSKQIDSVGYGATEAEATMEAERGYEAARNTLFVIPGESPQSKVVDLVADGIRHHQAAMSAGGQLPPGLVRWFELNREEREEWRVKAEHYMRMHDVPPEPKQVRGQDLGGALLA